MQSTRCAIRALLAGTALWACAAHAALVNAPLPTSAYITFGGYDWAWAFPVAPDGVFGRGSTSSQYFIDLSYQAQFGWRLPTAAEMLLAPDAVDFKFAGANVKAGTGTDPVTGAYFQAGDGSVFHVGADAACAVAYFSTSYRFCDWVSGNGPAADGFWVPGLPYGFGSGQQTTGADTLVIRAASTGSAVPEPGTLTLAGLSLSALWAVRRRLR